SHTDCPPEGGDMTVRLVALSSGPIIDADT
ncbi:MAG: hypothetical protein ACI8RZ_002225, partial [Myxococcota bacterium]